MPVHLAESPLTCVAVGSGRSSGIRGDPTERQVAPKQPPALLQLNLRRHLANLRRSRASQPRQRGPGLDRSRPRPQPFPSGSARRSGDGPWWEARAALTRLTRSPSARGRAGRSTGRGSRGDGAPSIRGGCGTGRANHLGCLRLLRRSGAREAGELASEAAGERAPPAGVAGPVRRRSRTEFSRSS